MVYFEVTIFDSQEDDKICFACNKDIEKSSKFKIYKICSEKDIHIDDNSNLGQILDELMSQLVEPKLIQPTFVMVVEEQ